MRATSFLGLVAVLVSTVGAGAADAAAGYRPQITNGSTAPAGEYPFMVALVSSGVEDRFQGLFCGGSLLFEDWVLTAAHCVEDGGSTAPADTIDVVIGSIDLAAEDGERIAAERIIAHPDYDEVTLQNDLALIQLSEPSTAGGTIQWNDTGADLDIEEPGTVLTLTGWGGLTVDQENQTFPTVLQEAMMPVLSDDECASEEQIGSGYDPITMLCAGAPEQDADGGIDACQGDSGGPLFATFPEGGRVQVGIVSFGPTCGLTATAYTRVSTYSDWISETTEFGPVDDEVAPRIAGANRYATAANLAMERYSPGVAAAFVVTGTAFPDALAAAAAAGQLAGPILLTTHDVLPPETEDALAYLEPEAIVVVGGGGAISSGVTSQLAGYTEGEVMRIAGENRYDTAARISQFAFPDGGGGLVAFLASGESFADALPASAAAAFAPQVPLLLTASDALPAATADELVRFQPSAVYVFGGTAAVSDAVLDEIVALGFDVERIAGESRYETSAMVSERFWGAADEVVVATGLNFPDGLVAGALGLPLLLLPAGEVPAVTQDAVSNLGATRVLVMGGEGAVSEEQARILQDLVAG